MIITTKFSFIGFDLFMRVRMLAILCTFMDNIQVFMVTMTHGCLFLLLFTQFSMKYYSCICQLPRNRSFLAKDVMRISLTMEPIIDRKSVYVNCCLFVPEYE